MNEQLLSYEVNAVTGAVSIKKRKYITELDEFGNEVTNAVNWRCVIEKNNDTELYKHLNTEQANAVKGNW